MNDIATSPASSSAQDIETTAWHALPAQAVLEQLSAAAEGLSSAEARVRLERFGPNRLPPPARRGALARFMAQFQNPLIHVLLGAAAVAVLLGEWENALVILGVAVINAAVGFIQEGKAEAALDAIRSMLSPCEWPGPAVTARIPAKPATRMASTAHRFRLAITFLAPRGRAPSSVMCATGSPGASRRPARA